MQVLQGVRDLSEFYDGFLLDQYGVIHDGEQPLPGALDCLRQLRAAGKRLVVVSNSPCEGRQMTARLEKLGFDLALFDGLVTSGDLVRRHLDELLRDAKASGKRLRAVYVSHNDHERRAVWSPSDLRDMGFELATSVEEADLVLANGVEAVYKGTAAEAPSDLENDIKAWGPLGPLLAGAVERGLPLIVANPDRIICRAGGRMVNCPGVLADEYERLGGKTPPCYGKPGPAIFEEARASLAALGATRVCHVGDSLHHDVSGAQGAGVPVLFVEGGIHRQELAAGASLGELLGQHGATTPSHTIKTFSW